MPSLLTPDPGLLFWMLLAFVIVFIILAKFGFPVITKMVEDRKNYIDESLKKAREANEKLANIQSESELIMRQAREKQAEILKEAMATRDNIIKEARDKADIESKKIIESAKEQIKVEKDLAIRDIRSQIINLSTQVSEKVLRRELDDNNKQLSYIDSLLDEIEAVK
jgi:F-type H+-transporting ATPase subunit b